MSHTHIGWTGRAFACASALGVALAVSFTAIGAQPAGRAVPITATSDRALADWDRQIDGLKAAGSLRLSSSKPDLLLPGRTHERMDQYFDGVRVYGAQTVRQLTAEGQAVSVFGTVHSQLSIDTRPTLGADQAIARAEALSSGQHMTAHLPELLILPRGEGQYTLVWLIRVATRTDALSLFVDAKTGDEVRRMSDIQHEQAVGTGRGVLGDQKKISADQRAGAFFADDQLRPPSLVTLDMKGNLDRLDSLVRADMRFSPSDVAVDTDNQWTDGAVVDAHTYMGYTYDYYFKRFGRIGLDNRNLPVVGVVHPVKRSELFDWVQRDPDVVDTFYLNAFYCGTCGNGTGTMVFGEGLPPEVTVGGQFWNYLSGALDVVGHELTHGVTLFSSGLIYQGESGALNEAFSDIMGTSVEFYFQPAGSGSLKADYLIGEDVITPRGGGDLTGLRSMDNPAPWGQPDHYSQRYLGPEDNGGVHINSSIGNQAFYLAVEGGTNRTSRRSVMGVGAANREQMEKIFYRAFTQLLPPDATFSVARRATLQAASDLYGGSSTAFRAVEQAWDAVGVQ